MERRKEAGRGGEERTEERLFTSKEASWHLLLFSGTLMGQRGTLALEEGGSPGG